MTPGAAPADTPLPGRGPAGIADAGGLVEVGAIPVEAPLVHDRAHVVEAVPIRDPAPGGPWAVQRSLRNFVVRKVRTPRRRRALEAAARGALPFRFGGKTPRAAG